MAKILYEVKQNQNEHNAAFGKWYAKIKSLETLNTRRLAQHIAEHGSIYTPDVVYGVMEKFRSCLLEMLLNSKKVKIEGLGTFYTTIECQKGGAVSKDKFNVNKDVKGLHIRFLPDSSSESQLNSKDILAKATFMWAEDLKREKAEARPTTPSNGGGSEQGGGSSTGSESGGCENGGGENPSPTPSPSTGGEPTDGD